ncbi:MAG TPA: protein kinase, partial [Pyrinomonadaceae bacterium]|nr:protein kinase [Pyrinomonadaceae bacterium]
MSEPQRANLVEQLFHEALDIDPAHRAEFLTKACEGDMVLLAEVTSLLASYERGGDFLQRPAFKLSASDVAGEVLGEDDGPLLAAPRIKGYRLLREVGRGGMGAVYLAVRADDNSQKRVAIKVVKRGMDTDFILRRFEREQRILAALNHPYIARLLDGG